MQSLIKWPGGKTSEYEIIKQYIPKYNRYIEPFFGGGAIFFNMQPQKAIINDISVNLMKFYQLVKINDKKFRDYIYRINYEWERLKQEAKRKAELLCPLFILYRNNEYYKEQLIREIESYCYDVATAVLDKQLQVVKDKSLMYELLRMVKNKVIRTRKNEIKYGYCLSNKDLKENILTGFTSGYYMYLRAILNQIEKQNDLYIENEYKIAIYYFVREFCYGSMFRYNNAGEFNIPYGGINYNNKDFKKKIDLLFSKETQSYFKDTEIFSSDFENILNMAQEEDFIFLDPPYDTDFSNYENRNFSELDQRRLSKRLYDIKAKFLLVIKNTPLISELYQNNGYRIYAFDNRYSYCVRGRNDRNAVHLIVTNYD